MGKRHIVVSMDSHTELLVDLKPFLAKKHHEMYTAGLAQAEYEFRRTLEAFLGGGLQEDEQLGELNYQIPEATREYTFEEYNRPIPVEERLQMIDEDGVAAEFLAAFVGSLSPMPMDLEFMHAQSLAYHRYFADYVSPAPWRFTGSAALNLCGGIDMAVKEAIDAYDHGLRAVQISGSSIHAGEGLPQYNSSFYDPLWQALDDRKMAVCFHTGAGRERPLLRYEGKEPGWGLMWMWYNTVITDGLVQLLAGGVPERFPNLVVGVLESGANWLMPLLATLDMFAKTVPEDASSVPLDMLPSEMWHQCGFVSGTLDESQLNSRHAIGMKNLMWGSDLPHVEGTYPNSMKWMADLFGKCNVPDDEIDMIVGGNAIAAMGFDREKLATTKAAQQEWPEPAV